MGLMGVGVVAVAVATSGFVALTGEGGARGCGGIGWGCCCTGAGFCGVCWGWEGSPGG
jgi:hypothetical protein